LSGNNLFVANEFVGTIGEYDAITGLNEPFGLALSGNDLFVGSYAGGSGTTVGEYDATTGHVINPSFITGLNGPAGLAVSGNTLFVANLTGGTVGEYDATTGAAINTNFITGLNEPAGLAVATVPEPSPWSMIAVGGVALLGIMLRKNHRIA
jgi:hypothetical protein